MMGKATSMAMAVAAIALALPSGALAGPWKHHTQEIQQNRQITLTGSLKFQGMGGEIQCEVTSQMTLLAGTSTAEVTKYEPDLDTQGTTVTGKCKTGGFIAGCQIHVVQPTGFPWVAHNETQKVQIKTKEIHISMTGAFCMAQSATITESTLFLTPNQPKTFQSFTVSGCANADVGAIKDPCASTSGTLNVLAPDAGTYSLE